MVDWRRFFIDVFDIKPDVIVKYKDRKVVVEVEKIKEVMVEKLVYSNTYTTLEDYCNTTFKHKPKFAYKYKRMFKEFKYSVYPNELIQPDKFLVDKARRSIGTKGSNLKYWYLKVGKYVDNKLLWTSDENTRDTSDYFSSPVESLISKPQDCEDHSFLAASLEPELGVAFGYCGEGGHAWNVFVHEGELWCLETNSVFDRNSNARIFKYDDQDRYKIHWIFTRNNTYQCTDRPVNFGTVDKL